MSFESEFLGMMPQSITYHPYSSISTAGYGGPSYGTSKTVRCRIQAARANNRDLDSREIVGATFKVLTAPYSTSGTSDSVTITAMDKITLPTAFLVAGSCSPPIIRAYPVHDETTGVHHNEVWI
jgi:hypothetical protein